MHKTTNSSLSTEETKQYNKLIKKLEDTGGKIYIKKDKVYTDGGKLKIKERSTLKKLHAKENGIQTKTISKEEQAKANEIKNKRKSVVKNIREHNLSIEELKKKTKLFKERELSRKFRKENPNLLKKMDDFELIEGEHYHYIQNNEGEIFIKWNSHEDDRIANKIDKFLEKIAPDEAYSLQEWDMIDEYTGPSSEWINRITLIGKNYKKVINNKEFKEKFIKHHGKQRWKTFIEHDLPKAYSEAYIEYAEKLRNECHMPPRDVITILRKAFTRDCSKIPGNMRIVHGQDRWYGELPKVGDEDELGVFLSSSHDDNVVDGFAFGESTSKEVIIEVDCFEGTDALLIGDRGVTGGEREILLRPDQNVRYTNIFIGDDGRTHVVCKTINDVNEVDNLNMDMWFDKLTQFLMN